MAISEGRDPVSASWAGRVLLGGLLAVGPSVAIAAAGLWYFFDTTIGGYGLAMQQMASSYEKLGESVRSIDNRLEAFDRRIFQAVQERGEIRLVVEGDIQPAVEKLEGRLKAIEESFKTAFAEASKDRAAVQDALFTLAAEIRSLRLQLGEPPRP